MSFHGHSFCKQTHTRVSLYAMYGLNRMQLSHRHRHVLGLGGFHHLLLVDQGGHLEERVLLHLVAVGAHKVVDGPHLGGQRAPDAGLARDWKRAAVRFACTRGRHRGDAIVRVGGNGQGAACVPSAVASPKRGTRTDVGAARGLGPIVILIVSVLQVVVVVHTRASLLAAARLARVVVVFVVVIIPACTAWLVGPGTLVRCARTHR